MNAPMILRVACSRQKCRGLLSLKSSFSSSSTPRPFLSPSFARKNPNASESNANNFPDVPGKVEEEEAIHDQPFVDVTILPGEWDPKFTNPLYRPKFRKQAKIISAEDFARAPQVSFSVEYESPEEAMAVLSWMDHSVYEEIYKLYCDLMMRAHEKHGRTSHEYVCRVVAQKFQITVERAAGIIELQHNQEKIVASGGTLQTELANYMDVTMHNEIAQAYGRNTTQPESFIEDPAGVNAATSLNVGKSYRVLDDIYDAETMLEDAIVRDDTRAKLMINNHRYIEDADNHGVIAPVDKECKKLLKLKERLASDHAQAFADSTAQKEATKKPTDPSVTDSSTARTTQPKSRPPWKFVAQIVNTRDLKRSNQKHRSYRNNSPQNTLVEQDGTLRVATMDEINHTSWKPVRHKHEHIYKTVKKDWLDHIIRGKPKVWGKQMPRQQFRPSLVDSDFKSEEMSTAQTSVDG